MKMTRINVIRNIAVVLLVALVFIQPVFAQDTIQDLKTQIQDLKTQIQDLKKQIQHLQKRLDSLEVANIHSQNQKQQNIVSRGIVNPNKPDNWGWDLFDQTGRIQDELNLMFKNLFSNQKYSSPGMFSSSISFSPNLDIQENKDGYVVIFNMKGFDEQKIDMEINEHSITVRAEHSKKDKKGNKNGYYSTESYG